MARVVVFTDPGAPGIRPPLEIFAELARRGEQLIIYAGATYRDAVEAAGATYRGYHGIGREGPARQADGMARRMDIAERVLPEVLEALRADLPDYLVLDAAAIWGRVAGEVLRLPTISYRRGPPVGRDLCDAKMAPEHRESAGRLDRQYGSRTADLAACMECRCDLNLVLLSRVWLADAAELDGSYRFVGSCAADPTDAGESPWSELETDPLIYVSLETALDGGEALLRACVEAFGGLPFAVVVRLGQGQERRAAGPAPRNFRLVASAPQAQLLERATLAITSGDARTVEECARAGVLQLLYPQDGEQRLMAARVEELGVGLRLQDSDLEGGRLRAVAGRVMADPRYCRAAEALRDVVRAGGAAQACDQILAFAGRTGTRGR